MADLHHEPGHAPTFLQTLALNPVSFPMRMHRRAAVRLSGTFSRKAAPCRHGLHLHISATSACQSFEFELICVAQFRSPNSTIGCQRSGSDNTAFHLPRVTESRFDQCVAQLELCSIAAPFLYGHLCALAQSHHALQAVSTTACQMQVIQPQRWLDPLWRLTSALEAQLGCLVGLNAYITPAGMALTSIAYSLTWLMASLPMSK